MQLQVIDTDEQGFNNMLYRHDDNVLNYLKENIQTASERLGGYGSGFIDAAKSMYNKVNGAEAIDRAKELLYSIGGHLDGNSIEPLYEDNIYEATHIMQRYIMVEPTIYELNQRQRCNGFNDQYFDINPDIDEVEFNDDYRAVMDGVLQFDDNGVGYVEEHLDSEDLHYIDKISIMDTWDTVKNMIAQDLDPTSLDENDREL